MTDARAISAQLVDIKNVGVHKSVRLVIDAPQELADSIIKTLGWPTMASPIPVAVARLDLKAADQSRPEKVTEYPGGKRRKFEELTPAQQAGILCGHIPFRAFLNERFDYATSTDEEAAEAVRELCMVKSRSLLTTDNAEWSALLLSYRLWEKEPEVIG